MSYLKQVLNVPSMSMLVMTAKASSGTVNGCENWDEALIFDCYYSGDIDANGEPITDGSGPTGIAGPDFGGIPADVRAKIRPIAEMGIIPNFLTSITYQNHIFESTDGGQTLDIYAKGNEW